MSLKFFDKLSQNFIELLNEKNDYNVIIEVENKEKLFTAHSNILKYRSQYFRKELENIQPNENNIKTIKSSVSAQIFDIILKYIYGGIVNLENVKTRFIFDLMLAANEFELDELTNKLETHLIDTKASWLKTYFSLIYLENKEKLFTAHSNILKYRSQYFRKELENIQPNENNIKTIKSSVSAQIFDIILKYIYGGIVNLENVKTRFIFDLMLAANEFELDELTNKLETHLIDTKASWLKTYFSLIYRTIFSKSNFKNLENYCNDIITKHPSLIFENSDFASLPESALISLLKRDELKMEEVKIWDYVIKWGIAQNPTLPVNLEEWSKENFLTLKITLQQCLPLIRYFHISNTEIVDKIVPYKRILDKQLWKDIIQHLGAPDRPVKSIILPARSASVTELPLRAEVPKEPFSTIISEEHAAEISSWIDCKTTTYSTKNIPYKFELILNGTKDGFAPQTFWNICHGHAKTVVITKVKGTDEILGGYNPLAWDNTYVISDLLFGRRRRSNWMGTGDSFIFSLKNGNIQNSILSRINNSEYAIWNAPKAYQDKFGPRFGVFYLYSEKSNFTLDNKNYYAINDLNQCYEKPIRTSTLSDHFSIINYEVFKIVRKS
ncbi:hypothetical protein Glove_50g64 [Diversispora epigaea]|uniref:BTB domain-containing protein n=1 Tax=Diversispora epigaea TaxID=1348612 RepID=A0A397JIC9_9GLOM|nr:hypothetical protein Glove_50g64 [Diversispora epigaea]